MRNLEERVRKIQRDMRYAGKSESEIRATLSELRRQEAVQSIRVAPVAASKATQSPWAELLNTDQGKTLVQSKASAEANRQAREQAHLEMVDRIRQLKALTHDVFVNLPHTAEPIQGWVPRVRFDLYVRSKDVCRQLGHDGGQAYDRALVSLRYALTGSRAYREAVEVLGL